MIYKIIFWISNHLSTEYGHNWQTVNRLMDSVHRTAGETGGFLTWDKCFHYKIKPLSSLFSCFSQSYPQSAVFLHSRALLWIKKGIFPLQDREKIREKTLPACSGLLRIIWAMMADFPDLENCLPHHHASLFRR